MTAVPLEVVKANPVTVLVEGATAVRMVVILEDMTVAAATAVGTVVMLADMTAVAAMMAAVATVEDLMAVVAAVVMVGAGEISFPNSQNAYARFPLDNLATKH
jgi:hypothetical protein